MPVEVAPEKRRIRVGYVLSAAAIIVLLRSAWMKLSGDPQVTQQIVEHFGYPASALAGIGLLELACVLVYALPRTATLGALMLTGYLGGAIATHVRIEESFVVPLAVAAVAWIGLFLRDEGVQEIAARMMRRSPQAGTARRLRAASIDEGSQ